MDKTHLFFQHPSDNCCGCFLAFGACWRYVIPINFLVCLLRNVAKACFKSKARFLVGLTALLATIRSVRTFWSILSKVTTIIAEGAASFSSVIYMIQVLQKRLRAHCCLLQQAVGPAFDKLLRSSCEFSSSSVVFLLRKQLNWLFLSPYLKKSLDNTLNSSCLFYRSFFDHATP